jgi:hypothetical protein
MAQRKKLSYNSIGYLKERKTSMLIKKTLLVFVVIGASVPSWAVWGQNNSAASTDMGTVTMENDRDLGNERLSNAEGAQNGAGNTNTKGQVCPTSKQDGAQTAPAANDTGQPTADNGAGAKCPSPK